MGWPTDQINYFACRQVPAKNIKCSLNRDDIPQMRFKLVELEFRVRIVPKAHCLAPNASLIP
jgi:hypothetical protein